MKMKSLKAQFIGAIAMVLVAAIAMGSSTYAWFAANNRVTATGMQVNATTSQSLVIATQLMVGNQTTVSLNSTVNNLIPATHDTTAVPVNSSIDAVNTSTDQTGLNYNTNPQNVSSSTGYANSATALTFAKAANNGESIYYQDFIVYIASAGAEMTGSKLQAYLYTGSEITTDTTKATSVDFYISQDSANMGKYAGTLNLSTLTAGANSDGVTYYTSNLDLIPSDGKIPQNNSNSDYLKVTMRVYYDGALQKAASTLTEATGVAATGTNYYDAYGNKVDIPVGESVVGYYTGAAAQAYVYSDVVTTAGTMFNVSFKAVSNA